MAPNTWPGWEYVQLLGRGSYGYVYKIKRTEFGQEYYSALKVIEIPQHDYEATVMLGSMEQNLDSVDSYYREQAESILNEVRMMANFQGVTNIVSYEDHMIIPKEEAVGYYVLIRMELLTPLRTYLETSPPNDALIVKLGTDICRALEYCERCNVIHRDIKPANIFVNRHGDFKLGDFGIARRLSAANTTMTQRGTERYMAPEIYLGHYGFQVDIYSLGLVLYQYLNEDLPPFCNKGNASFSDYQDAHSRRIRGDIIPPPMHGSEELKKTILRAVEYAPEKRFSTDADFREALYRASEKSNGGGAKSDSFKNIKEDANRANKIITKLNRTPLLIAGITGMIIFISCESILMVHIRVQEAL